MMPPAQDRSSRERIQFRSPQRKYSQERMYAIRTSEATTRLLDCTSRCNGCPEPLTAENSQQLQQIAWMCDMSTRLVLNRMQKSHQRQNKRLDTNRCKQLLHHQTERRIFMREAINQTHTITELRSRLRTSTEGKIQVLASTIDIVTNNAQFWRLAMERSKTPQQIARTNRIDVLLTAESLRQITRANSAALSARGGGGGKSSHYCIVKKHSIWFRQKYGCIELIHSLWGSDQ